MHNPFNMAHAVLNCPKRRRDDGSRQYNANSVAVSTITAPKNLPIGVVHMPWSTSTPRAKDLNTCSISSFCMARVSVMLAKDKSPAVMIIIPFINVPPLCVILNKLFPYCVNKINIITRRNPDDLLDSHDSRNT